ncbi:MAG: 16S rRNA (cytidine(1402)-2'-O)-methyltransferase [Gemmobacter sp.]
METGRLLQGRHGAPEVAPGLHLVATPIGSARDITLRALDVLAGAEVLAAEDTRTLRRLLEIHGVALNGRPLHAYHDHNGAAVRPRLLRALAEGRSVAYAPEAGTPLVADPGFALARAAIAAGHPVHAVPGASAVLAALCVSGLPSDRFLFAGFPPPTGAARSSWLAELAGVPATLILYESPRRVGKLLGDMVLAFGASRRIALCRELTKLHEEVMRGTIGDIASTLAGRDLRGEVVLVVDRAAPEVSDPADVDQALRKALGGGPVKAVAAEVAARFGLSRREVYQRALQILADGTDGS